MVWEDRVTDQDPIVECSGCRSTLPRSEMFGAEPDLLCPRCASGVRRRMHVRFRPLERERKPIVTVLCLGISILLFVCTDLIWRAGGDAARPAWLQALYQDSHVWVGEVWRHLGCVFLHGGWLHLAMNGMALWFLGRHVEGAWGSWALAALIVFTGVSSSAVSWIMSGSGVGISGALFGLCGFLWALRRVHPVAAAIMNERMIRWILMMLVLGVVLSASGRLAIGNWAHGAGLATGFLAGLAVRDRRRRLWVPLLGVLLLVLVLLSTQWAVGTTAMTNGETWSRARWREYWLTHYAP